MVYLAFNFVIYLHFRCISRTFHVHAFHLDFTCITPAFNLHFICFHLCLICISFAFHFYFTPYLLFKLWVFHLKFTYISLVIQLDTRNWNHATYWQSYINQEAFITHVNLLGHSGEDVVTVKMNGLHANGVLLKPCKVCSIAPSVFDDFQDNQCHVTHWHTLTLLLTMTLINEENRPNPAFLWGCYDGENEWIACHEVALKPWKVCFITPSVFDDLQGN